MLASHTPLSPQSCHAYPAPLSQRNITVSYNEGEEEEEGEGGGNFFFFFFFLLHKVEWKCNSGLPDITHGKFQQQTNKLNKQTNRQKQNRRVISELGSSLKLIRQDVWGGEVRGEERGGEGGTFFFFFLRQFTSTMRSRSFLTMKEVQKKNKTKNTLPHRL